MKTAAVSFRFICCLAACMLVAGTAFAAPQASLSHDGPHIEGGTTVDCEGYDAYQQPLDTANFNNARTSDEEAGFLVAESFIPGPYSGAVDGIRWWGINFDFVSTFCTDDDVAGTPFTVTFWTDTPDVGSIVCQQTGVAPTIVDTGVVFAGTTIGEYSAKFPECDATGATWVSIERETGVAGCFWLWVDEDLVGSYDDDAWQGATGLGTDHTMCVQAPADRPIVEVPSLGQFGLMALLLSLLGAGIYRIRRSKK